MRPARVGVAASAPEVSDLADPATYAAYAGARECGEEAVDALRRTGHDAFLVLVRADARRAVAELRERGASVVVNLVEELSGRAEGEIDFAERLEEAGLPFTGSRANVLRLTLDKAEAKRALAARGVPTPRWTAIPESDLAAAAAWSIFPAIVKPSREDGSLGIDRESVCDGASALLDRVARVHGTFRQPALVEEYVEGRELNVAMLEGAALPIAEIEFGESDGPKIVTFAAKWSSGSEDDLATRPVCPARIPHDLEARVREMAGRVFQGLGIRDYGRVDVRVDADGHPFVLEANANPDLSASAGFARSARVAGIDATRLWAHLVQLALTRAAAPAAAGCA
ncbi:MAG TPA: D-alanine--D-alanine ligase [Planctomycetota bacterium]|nr:D-alanine--D-alanine ligase [Planctomycetota bacterium]